MRLATEAFQSCTALASETDFPSMDERRLGKPRTPKACHEKVGANSKRMLPPSLFVASLMVMTAMCVQVAGRYPAWVLMPEPGHLPPG